MKRFNTLAIASCLALLALAFVPSGKADQWNKKTILTVNEPVAVPGRVLEPGKYVMKLQDSQADRHIVQIYNEDESQLLDTVLAIPNYRLQPTGKTQFGFWETASNAPRALKAWFYPGDNFGQEFAYPKEMATKIAQTSNENVPTVEGEGANAQITETTPNGQSQPMSSCNCTTPQNQTSENQNNNANQTAHNETAQTQPVQPAPEPQPQTQSQPDMTAQNTQPAPVTPAPEQNNAQTNNPPAPAPQSQALPRTASPFPLVGLAGLLAFAAALAVRVISKQVA